MAECLACGAWVSDDFARVFGDEDGEIHACFDDDCAGRTAVIGGAGAGLEQPTERLDFP